MSYQLKRAVQLERLIEAPNVCDLLDDDDIASIGNHCMEGYAADVASRSEWERRKANANKLALQVTEEKTFPWPHSSNIKFPLVTVAALQFQARAYPALISGSELVKCRVFGDDPKGEKTARGERISTHMSWQCLEQDRGWEEEHDKAILAEAIAGCVFVKQVFDPGIARIKTQLVLPKNLVINYFTRSLQDSRRYTHTFELSRNDIAQRELDKRYRPLPTKTGDAQGRIAAIQPDVSQEQDQLQAARDQRQGITNPNQDDVTPFFTGEMYTWFDLDKDGYEEPYVVVFDITSGVVRRIFARFLPSAVKFVGGESLAKYGRNAGDETEYDIPKDARVYNIEPVRVFTKYGFIPSPDGGFYDLGLGDLVGPINEGVNNALDQLFDAATMKNLGGGFLGRAFKGRSGPITFAPQMWHPLDNAGEDIRKSVMPLPVPEPSTVLFQLVGFLVQYAERIVSATDIQMGESPGQNMKAGTAEILNQNGSRVYSAIYKRNWRALRDEFDIRYELNALYFAADEDYADLTTGRGAIVRADDYAGASLLVRPAADPYVISDHEAEQMATKCVQLANQVPGFNRYRTTRRLLKAMKVPNIEEVYPEPKDPQSGKPMPDYPPPPNPKLLAVQQKQAELQLKAKQFEADQVQMKIDTLLEAQESQARIAKMIAETEKIKAEAKGAAAEPLIKMLYAQIESEGKHRDQLLKFAELIDKKMERMNGASGDGDKAGGDAGVAGLEGSPANAGVPSVPRSNGAGAPATMGGSIF
jgi:chaperonin GroES